MISISAGIAILLMVQSTSPFATIDQRTIEFHPSGATLQIPKEVFDGPQTRQFTTYLSRTELERVRSPLGDEWDHPYGSIVNAALPFESCAAHIGTEPFGPGPRAFSDLQMRVYIVDGPSKPVIDRIVDRSPEEAKKFSTNTRETAPQSAETWTVVTLTYDLRFRDYGGTARIDFHVKEFGNQTAVLVFMYSPNTRWPWAQPITDIVDSFAWPGTH